jgi:hypothetical protein
MCGAAGVQLWRGIDDPARPARKTSQNCKICGRKATAGLPQRGKRASVLELWQISTIMD